VTGEGRYWDELDGSSVGQRARWEDIVVAYVDWVDKSQGHALTPRLRRADTQCEHGDILKKPGMVETADGKLVARDVNNWVHRLSLHRTGAPEPYNSCSGCFLGEVGILEEDRSLLTAYGLPVRRLSHQDKPLGYTPARQPSRGPRPSKRGTRR